MSYATNGKYQFWGDYLVGYKCISLGARSLHDHKFKYREGHWAVAKGVSSVGGIYHAAELHEVANYFDSNGIGMGRVVRLLIRPDDLISRGRATRAFVQAISPVLREWPKETVQWPVLAEPASHWWQKPRLELDVVEQLPALPAPEPRAYAYTIGQLSPQASSTSAQAAQVVHSAIRFSL